MRNKSQRFNSVPFRAFTLIEILVVVAIIALLISIMLPSLAAARRQARSVVCRAGEHQMGLALTMYLNQYGYFPGHHLPLGSETPTQFILWPVRLMRFMKGSSGSGGQYQIYWCTESKYKTRWNGQQRLWYSSTEGPPQPNDCFNFDYGYNDWGVGETFNVAGAPNLGLGGHVVTDNRSVEQKRSGEVRLSKVKRPADMITIADNDADDVMKGQAGTWDTAIDPIDDSGREWPGARHDKGCNVLWADGHADWQLQKKLVEKTHGARRKWNNDFRAHCKLWGDGSHNDDHPEENKYNR